MILFSHNQTGTASWLDGDIVEEKHSHFNFNVWIPWIHQFQKVITASKQGDLPFTRLTLLFWQVHNDS